MSKKELVFHCEYAPSGRAKCRVCKGSIPKGQLRLATSQPFAEPSMPDEDVQVNKQRQIAAEAPKWCHADCFRKFRVSADWWRKNVDDAENFIGWADLKERDQRELRNFVEAVREGKTPGLFTHSDPDAPTQDPFISKEREDDSNKARHAAQVAEGQHSGAEEAAVQGRGSLKRKEGPRQKRRSTPLEEQQGSEPKKKRAKAEETRASQSPAKPKSASKESHSEDSTSAASKASGETSTSTGDSAERLKTDPGPLSEEERSAIKRVADDVESFTVSKLKELLRINDQKISGTKEELVQRVAECQVLGAIPRCPDCQGGHLRFDQNSGVYSCPGYMDEDGEYRRCGFKSKQVDRVAWKSM